MSSCDDPRQHKEIIFFHDHQMSAKTIAVLDYADLKDGQMYVIKCFSHLPYLSPCCTGKKFRSIQERSSYLV